MPAATMAKETVVITGATGFIGGRVLQLLLEQDYNVRIVARSNAKKQALLSNPRLKGIEKAEFVIVPDLQAPGCLDKAVAGADYIVHLASPIPMHGDIPAERQNDELVVPAVNATLRALEAAQKSGTVKRVVVTSSAVALIPPSILLPSDDPPTTRVITGNDRLPAIEPPFENAMVAYIASKIAAQRASDKFMKEQSPAFDVVNIQPP
jgi:nucleoside-diphosphate-sugar epimerase